MLVPGDPGSKRGGAGPRQEVVLRRRQGEATVDLGGRNLSPEDVSGLHPDQRPQRREAPLDDAEQGLQGADGQAHW